jgi:hypothetical protein
MKKYMVQVREDDRKLRGDYDEIEAFGYEVNEAGCLVFYGSVDLGGGGDPRLFDPIAAYGHRGWRRVFEKDNPRFKRVKIVEREFEQVS